MPQDNKQWTPLQIKELVVSGNAEQIQSALDTNQLKRKKNYARKEVDYDNHRIPFTLTHDSVDRDSERVLPKSFENNMEYYLENPVVLYGHNHSQFAVGRMVETVVMDAEVYGMVEFAVGLGYKEADVLWELYSAETPFMRMGSIGFIPLKWSDNDGDKLEGQSGVTYQEIEPIEFSLVNIGSNRYALSDLPMKIRTDSVMKDAYERLVEDKQTVISVSEKAESQPKQESITMATEKDKLESKEETSESEKTAEPEKEKQIDYKELALELLAKQTTSSNDEPTEEDVALEQAKKEAELKKAQAEVAKAEADIAESKAKVRQMRLEVKGEGLGDYLNEQVGDGEDRDDLIAQISEESDRSIATINGILNGTTECPDEETVAAFSNVLSIDEDVILQYADMDGCEVDDEESDEDDEIEADDTEEMDDDEVDEVEDDDETSEVDDEDDEIDNIVMNEAGIQELAQKAETGNVKAIRKFYGICGMFDGSFEEIKSLINDKISGYLEYELALQDEWFIDYDILCTKQSEVLVYSYHKKQVYKIEYNIDAKDIEFTSIEPVKLTYEMVEMMDDEKDFEPTPETLAELSDTAHAD